MDLHQGTSLVGVTDIYFFHLFYYFYLVDVYHRVHGDEEHRTLDLRGVYFLRESDVMFSDYGDLTGSEDPIGGFRSRNRNSY